MLFYLYKTAIIQRRHILFAYLFTCNRTQDKHQIKEADCNATV